MKYPTLECLHNFKAHDTDVDDLDIHPNGKRVRFGKKSNKPKLLNNTVNNKPFRHQWWCLQT